MVFLALLACTAITAQEIQKNFINYQGVARDSENNLIENRSIIVGIALRFGSPSATKVYEEVHSISTDANGVFSLQIGNGDLISGSYASLLWDGATFMTVSLDGVEVGTTELMAVPYAIASGDKQWTLNGSNIENKNEGDVIVQNNFKVNGGFNLSKGNQVNEISDNGSLTENSNGIIPTQRAVKTYVDNRFFSGGGVEQNAAEVPYDNTTSGLAATNAQGAIDELASSSSVDTDNQNLSLSGTVLQITDGTGVDLSPIIPPGGTDDQRAGEVPYDNTISGLTASDTQAAIDELASGGLVDTDDQALVLTGDVLTIEDGLGSVDLSMYRDDGDADPNNEIQDIALLGTELSITSGSTIDLRTIIPPGGTDDQNAAEVPFDNAGTGLAATDTQAAIEELASSGLVDTDNQALVLTGDVLSIEDGLGSVDLGNYVDVTTRHGLLVGDDGLIDGLMGTVDGQVVKWDAALGNWVVGTDEVGAGGGSLWTQDESTIFYNSGNVGLGNTDPGVEPGAGKYLTVATGTSPSDNSFASIEIQGGQGVNNRPVGRLDFISNSSPGNSAIARIESRTSSGAQFRGDLGFSTQDGGSFASRDLVERMTIKNSGNVGIGTTAPTAKLEVNGDFKTSGEIQTTATGTANMIPIAYGQISADGLIESGSGNINVVRTETGSYQIRVSGAGSSFDWVVSATRHSAFPSFISVLNAPSSLHVKVHNLAGDPINGRFSFVIYIP